jgi:glutamyl-tRNA reductase
VSLLAVGLNHRTAPTVVLERATVGPDDLEKLLHDLLQGEHVAEAVVLSTCNRVEVFAETTTFHGGLTEISDQLARISGLPLEELTSCLYVHHEARAVAHLFAVVCGLDSMLVGEAQILGQVRSAYKLATSEGSTGRSLSVLFREAMRVGKRAHSETRIDEAAASLVGVAVEGARTALGDLAGRSVLVVGAGSTGALAGTVLRRAEVGSVVVANRTRDRGARLAQNLGGRAVGLGDAELVEALAEADVVVTATGSTAPVVPAVVVKQALERRASTHAGGPEGVPPLVFLDLALPRDVDPEVAALPGVTLIDLEGLRSVLKAGAVGADVELVRELVADEVSAFCSRQRALRVTPTVTALRAQAAEVVRGELERLTGRVPDLDDRERAEVESTVRRVVDKLLHAPTVRVKELAASPDGDRYAEALHMLFDLDRNTPSVLSVPTADDPAADPVPGAAAAALAAGRAPGGPGSEAR